MLGIFTFFEGYMLKKKKATKIIFIAIILLFLFFIISNIVIINNGKKKLVSDEDMQALGADCILILGAGVRDDNHPSPILADRLEEGLRLYQKGISGKIIVSGDHGRVEYDEVNVMKQYLIDAGVPSEDIFMDHAGFSTYESMYRAKEIFGVQKMIIVTQEYHLYRALYICNSLGIEAYGSPADARAYAGALMRNVREWIARDKDILYCALKVKPTYLGEAIDLSGSGNVTND